MGRLHGDSLLDINTTNMFRFALLICSVAYATAEADASYGYGGYGGYGHLGYAGYGGPVAHAHSTGPHLPNVVQHVPYGYAASGVYRAANAGALHLAKRSADADALRIRRIRRIRPPGLRWIRWPCRTCSLHWTPPPYCCPACALWLRCFRRLPCC